MSNLFPFLQRRPALLCALLLSLLILAGCSRGSGEPPQTEPVAPITDPTTVSAPPQTTAPQTETDAPLPFSTEEGTQLQTAAPTPVTNPPVTNPPVTNPPVTNPPVTDPPVTNPPVTNPPVTTAAPDGTARVPKSDAVSDDYFADAAIIGDSRTVGLSLWSGLRSNYFSEVALNVLTVQSKAFVADDDGNKLTLKEALVKFGPFSRVYISFGINEIGWTTEGFFSTYRSLISMIREVMPDAVIYVESVLPMTKAASEGYYAQYGGNARVAEYNEGLYALCEELGLYFLDLNETFADENGNLNVDDSADGVHLGLKSVGAWADFLRTHTVR